MNKPLVVYVPPSAEQIKAYVQSVSDTLALRGDTRYLDMAVVGGLTDYFNLLAKLTAKYLSDDAHELLDKRNS